MTSDPQHLPTFWHLLTRLGEMQILLPAALLAWLAMLRRPDSRPLAGWWLVFLLASALLTTASKLAFIGWVMGSAALNFTGISGHAMFAAAICPLLLGTLASHVSPAGQRMAIGAGFGLALLVGMSRLEVGAHSVSEVVAGLLLGGAASAGAMALAPLPRAAIGPVLPVLVAVWIGVMPLQAPPSQSHGLVTQLALRLSGQQKPHTRANLLRAPRQDVAPRPLPVSPKPING
jgi:membrane-associated phospholipid phosphatase